MSDTFQYESEAHRTDTAIAGFWLFLASEVLFFGGLFLVWTVYRQVHNSGFTQASQHSELLIGSINTVVLFTSSAVFAATLPAGRRGANRAVFWLSVATWVLGFTFLLLKLYEWKEDLDQNLFPGVHFSITGPGSTGAQLFWAFYFVATGLHMVHLLAGLVLVTWIALLARRKRFSAATATPLEVVGLYWAFVDVIWLTLFPLIYLSGRIG